MKQLPHYITRAEAVALLKAERARYASVPDMAAAWGIKPNSMHRILRDGRIEGHAARQLGLRPVTLYARD